MSEHDEIRKELAYYRRHIDEVAGENLKLTYMISGLRHELTQKRQGFALLSELQPRVGADKQLSSIFRTTIEAINSTLGMERTLVLAQTEREHHYRPTHWLGFRVDAADQLAALELEMPHEFAAATGALIVNRATPPTPLIERIRVALNLPFFIAVPVLGHDAPIGILLSGRLKEVKPLSPPLDEGDLDTFQAIAGLISASVRNMRLAVLEEMDRLKTDFFANISHEFRTPITLTIGPLEQLQAGRYGELSPPAVEQVAIMRRNQERLLALVTQILDLAKLEAGEMDLRAAHTTDVNRLVEERATQFRSAAEKRGVALRVSLDPKLAGADLYLDREQLDKLLFNLLSNALRFTKAGSIDVATALHEDAFRLTVSDTGIGIKEDQLPYIFDRFRQSDSSESREYAGTGIGLALVQEIAKLHGGSVSVTSQYGRGSTFRVTIPLGRQHLDPGSVIEATDEELSMGAPGTRTADVVVEGAADREGAGAANARAEAAYDPERQTILYAEDNADLRLHLRDLLADEYNVFLAVDGRDGLETARRYRPDLIITDQMMPNMSGRDLLHAIRADAELRRTPVIFLTARVGSDARIASLDAGADDYLGKPFHQGELMARVRNLLRARSQERQLAELNRRCEVRIEEQMGEVLRTGQLRRFLPPSLVNSILAGDLPAGDGHFERRRVTVLAAELMGVPELTEQLEPEELAELVNDHLRELTGTLVAAGATLDTCAAQRVVALFGAPQSLPAEDQAWTAVNAALQLRDCVRTLRSVWRRRGVAESVDLRIAISTGYCTVGLFGGEAMRAYAAVGTPVTIALLLQAEADAGSIVCALPVHALVETRVTSRPLGARNLHGFVRPVETVEILGPGQPPGEAPVPGPVFLPR
jgi:signal transduction histidine kinase/CheY-like chemotaxis protein/class 3 adenylate cyclase